ncbi:cobalamin-dependent protein, partial [Actinomadura luteofluorescens]
MGTVTGELHSPVHPVRFVTAAALFDGHDAAINIMRRILQSQGAEVVHLGHDRSVREVVDAVLEEDAQGVAISSYQGGHVEYFEYLSPGAGARRACFVAGRFVGSVTSPMVAALLMGST